MTRRSRLKTSTATWVRASRSGGRFLMARSRSRCRHSSRRWRSASSSCRSSSGAAKSMFTPLAMAVVFAMLASYLLSRTLIPTLVMYLLRDEVKLYHEDGEFVAASTGLISRLHNGFNHWFERLREQYHGALELALAHRRVVAFSFLA